MKLLREMTRLLIRKNVDRGETFGHVFRSTFTKDRDYLEQKFSEAKNFGYTEEQLDALRRAWYLHDKIVIRFDELEDSGNLKNEETWFEIEDSLRDLTSDVLSAVEGLGSNVAMNFISATESLFDDLLNAIGKELWDLAIVAADDIRSMNHGMLDNTLHNITNSKNTRWSREK